MSVLITGGPKAMGEKIIGIAKELAEGKSVEKVYYRELIPVTIENIDKVDTE